MAILRIRDAKGNVQEILAIKGEKGDPGEFAGGELLKAHIKDKENPHGTTCKQIGAAPASANAIDSGWLNDDWYCRKYNDMTELFGFEVSIDVTMDEYCCGYGYIQLPIELPTDSPNECDQRCYVSVTDYWGERTALTGAVMSSSQMWVSVGCEESFENSPGETFVLTFDIHIVCFH